MTGLGSLAGIIEGATGTFYIEAGASGESDVLSVTTQGVTTALATFPSGYNLESSLVSGPNGRFYSMIELSDDPANVFSITSIPGSKRTYPAQSIAASFTQNLPDGGFLGIGAQLIAMSTIFSVVTCDTQGNVTLVYQFPSGERVEQVMLANDGNFYGVSVPESGAGYIFRLTPAGTLTAIYTFASKSFLGPFSVALIQGSDGDLYGTVATGGSNGTGIIYKITLSGEYTALYTFPAGNLGGPTFLLEASDGNFYGATSGVQEVKGPGPSELFRMSASGEFTKLPFSVVCDCPMVQGSDGIIYGTTFIPELDAGAVFALDAGLPVPLPRVEHFTPSSGPVGTQVLIWGTQLLNPNVTFNGVPTASVISSGPNYVLVPVPEGASTGPILVTTPGGLAASSASFTVQ
jgi:uncharacterized repeat protein (TIGR03803 family)